MCSSDLGTPSSGNLTNCTFPTLNQNTTGSAATAANLSGGTLTTSSYILASSNNLIALQSSAGNGVFVNGSGAAFAGSTDNAMSLGTSGYRWSALHVAGTFGWGGYSIAAPAGGTSTFLRNDGTWAAPTFSGVTSFNTRTGAVTLSSGDVTGALGYAPYQTGGALGTPSSGNLTNCTFPTLNQNTTGSAATAANL